MIAGQGDSVGDPVGSGIVLAVAFAYFLCGCVALAAQGASLLALHAFAAFVVLSVVSASNQLVPVLTGARPLPPRGVLTMAAPFAAGFALLLAAFAGAGGLFPAAGILLLAGAALWSVWTVARIARAPLEGQTRAAVTIAAAAFLVAAGLGAAMALALGGRAAPGLLALAPAHASLAVVAFASTLIVAISYRFVPMFALAHTDEGRWTRSAQWLVAGAGVLGAAAAAWPAWQRAAFALAVVAALAAMAVHLRTLRARLRKRLDVSLRYAAAAWVSAVAAGLCAVAATWRPGAGSSAVALAVLGWLALSIIGYAFKIVGFLAWEHARRVAPDASLPPLGEAVPMRAANAALALLAVGALAVAAALGAAPGLLRSAAAVYAAGGVSAVVILWSVAWRYVGARA
ncbi:MAG TPA: hypothetical protein VNJ51_02605 [Candidatus Dormibacteraeota bacterium]|nr:hypothetical protein [Candidatus Dormibacteraeota bacterium]